MIGVGRLSLGRVAQLIQKAFSPLDLFKSGEQGVWYDPSDFDRYMSEIGPELVTNGDFSASAGWTVTNGSIANGLLTLSTNGASDASAVQNIQTTNGKLYAVTVTKVSATTSGTGAQSSAFITVANGGGGYDLGALPPGTYTFYPTVNFTGYTTFGIRIYNDTTTTTVFDNFSVRELTAINTATIFQNSTGSSPVTTLDQNVGLVLDSSKQQSWTDAAGHTWVKTAGDGVVSVSGNQITITGATVKTTVDRTGGNIQFLPGLASMTVTATGPSATGSVFWLRGSPSTSLSAGVPMTQRITLNNSSLERLEVNSGTVTFTINEFKFLLGCHAAQPTTGYQPRLRRGLVNLATYSHDLTYDAVWVKNSVSVAPPNTVTFPATGTTSIESHVLVPGGTGGRTLTVAAMVSTISGTKRFRLKNTHGAILDNFSADFTATATPQIFTFHVSNSGASGSGAQIIGIMNSITEPPAGTLVIGGIGLFQGNVSAEQILAAGGIPRTTTAPASAATGSFWWAFDGQDDALNTAFAAGTLPSNADVFMVVRRDNDTNDAFIYNPYSIASHWAGSAEPVATGGYNFSVTSAPCNTHGPTIHVDGVPLGSYGTVSRGAVGTALGVGKFSILEMHNLDLSAWNGLGFGGYGGGYNLTGAVGALVVMPAGDADTRAKVRKYLAKQAGITLAA